MRIVSLNCSNTEIVHALGKAGDLVGCDSDSDWPHEVVCDLPRVGRDLDVDIEAVTALRPDLVLASITVPGHEQVVRALDDAGLRYFAPETQSLDDVYTDIRTIADLLGVSERAEPIVTRMREAIELPHDDAPRPTVLVQWWPKPVIAPGQRSWVDDLLRWSGASNPLGHRDVKSEPVDDQLVAELDPDAIVISWCGVPFEKYRPDVVLENPAWRDVRAVRNGQVHCVPEAWLGRPSHRLSDGAQALRQIVEGLRSPATT